jgi:energy-coupling factor transporter ATP-binding protein EcfA2
MMAYIEVKDVNFAYPNGYLAVEHINLSIDQGENIAIVGQNGAGKSTFVKMLNALQYPTEGSIRIGDIMTKDHTTAQVSRVVGYVFQNPDEQIFHSTVRQEVEYGPKKMKLPKEKIEEQVNYALEITGMNQYADENPFNLPLSMRKFITIAAIIASDCSVMIFDEPTAGQDLAGNQLLAKILVELSTKGKTLITISHDMEFVVNNFQKVVVMANKKILKAGLPQEIFWDYDVLEKAMLKQPYVSRLCRSLGLNDGVVKLDDAVEYIMNLI